MHGTQTFHRSELQFQHRPMAHVSTSRESEVNAKRTRRLKPGVAAKFAAVVNGEEIRELYARPVQELSPEEIARMRAAFFRG